MDWSCSALEATVIWLQHKDVMKLMVANPQPIANDPLEAFEETQESMVQPETVVNQPIVEPVQQIETKTEIPSIEITSPIENQKNTNTVEPLPELTARPEPVVEAYEPKPEVDRCCSRIRCCSAS